MIENDSITGCTGTLRYSSVSSKVIGYNGELD